MTPPPLVSVVIPCYNQSHFLPDAIESALAQTYSQIEVVVVDDGSTDSTREVAERYTSKGVRVVSQPNSGLPAARNSGIAAARGTYICLLDSDDALTEDCVTVRLELMLSDPSIGLVTGHYVDVNESMNAIVRVPPFRLTSSTQRLKFADIVARSVHPAGWLFPRDLIRVCGTFDPFLKSAEDWDFLLRVAARRDIAYLPITTCLIRQHGASMSRNLVRMFDSAARVHRKMGAYSEHPYLYWLRSRTGMVHQTKYLFGRLLASSSRSLVVKQLAQLAIARPAVLIYGIGAVISYVLSNDNRPHKPVWGRKAPQRLSPESN